MKPRHYQSLISRVGNSLAQTHDDIAEQEYLLRVHKDNSEALKVIYGSLSKLQRLRVKLEDIQKDLKRDYRIAIQDRRP